MAKVANALPASVVPPVYKTSASVLAMLNQWEVWETDLCPLESGMNAILGLSGISEKKLDLSTHFAMEQTLIKAADYLERAAKHSPEDFLAQFREFFRQTVRSSVLEAVSQAKKYRDFLSRHGVKPSDLEALAMRERMLHAEAKTIMGMGSAEPIGWDQVNHPRVMEKLGNKVTDLRNRQLEICRTLKIDDPVKQEDLFTLVMPLNDGANGMPKFSFLSPEPEPVLQHAGNIGDQLVETLTDASDAALALKPQMQEIIREEMALLREALLQQAAKKENSPQKRDVETWKPYIEDDASHVRYLRRRAESRSSYVDRLNAWDGPIAYLPPDEHERNYLEKKSPLRRFGEPER